ncbi:hypothetical protein GGH12_000544 [Coemansia sp. RSA 1822]|nr:hypothetical protein LPJ76_000828 [Coemansia sp. RSA 638]KAJ2123485.1 hypothetical protein IW147_002543 [Coemansia sp. RSA 720]KAJ2566988.1 hypothetical protein GGH12_000544 [Coemansia sp. RSA 1822]
MSYLPTQPVGERVRFQSQMPGSMHSNDLQTPTRQGNTVSSPFRTTLRRSTYFEPESKANPFTPRVDRGLSPAGSRMLARRSTTLGTARTARSSLYMTDTPATSAAESNKQLPFATTAEYPALGGVGGWPVGNSVTTSAPLNSTLALAAGETEQGSKTPFSRPKSPATRSASPHRNAKKLPSFLLGSMQSVKSSGTSTPYPPDTALSANSTAGVTIYSIPSAQAPQSSRPVSPRVSRRISGFGSNDMLSSAYRSSGAGSSRGVGPASSLDDAPPIVTLDDMDMEHPGDRMQENDGLADTDVFAMQIDGSAMNGGHQQTAIDGSNAAGNEQDYSDVKARAVVVSGLPANTESSTLNYFRSFGEILAFSGVPGAADSLALLFSEPWQAQRAVAQGDSSGRILLDDRIVARVDRADAPSVSLLFKQVFPGRPLPSSAAPPVTESFTFSQAIYAQSPRRRPAASAPAHGRSRIEAVRDIEPRSSASAGSPFRHKQVLTHSTPASNSTVMASANGQASILSSSAPKPRNGLLQSVLDILFGW